MQSGPYRQDQPSRDGGDDRPTDAQLEGATADGAPTPNAGIEDATSGGDLLEIELNAERDRNLRLRAEIENLRTRGSRELADQIRYAALPMARDLLPVLDNIKMVRQQLISTLQQHQCQEIPALGAEFNPQFHAAILQQPSNDVPANHVMMVTQSGYQLHDRVVRPAQVIVSSGPAA
jgi:molecular chaperone GrpE